MDVPQKAITLENIKESVSSNSTKRINFSSSHAGALKKYNDQWKITLPFKDSIQPIIKKEIGNDIDLFDSDYGGVWRFITNEEYDKWHDFITYYKNIVFLRDCLDISLSLSMNIIENESRTEIGELEYQSKYNSNNDAEEQLVSLCKEWINKLPYYKDADLICAVPSNTPNNLPQRIVDKLDITATNISNTILWTSKTRNVKDAENVEDKISILEESGFTINNKEQLKNKVVILFDDLYMSGVTLQYIAMKLKEAGVQRVLGLTIVKSRSNSTR
jgi:Predicted amidophosphoribosyltransferases